MKLPLSMYSSLCASNSFSICESWSSHSSSKSIISFLTTHWHNLINTIFAHMSKPVALPSLNGTRLLLYLLWNFILFSVGALDFHSLGIHKLSFCFTPTYKLSLFHTLEFKKGIRFKSIPLGMLLFFFQLFFNFLLHNDIYLPNKDENFYQQDEQFLESNIQWF